MEPTPPPPNYPPPPVASVGTGEKGKSETEKRNASQVVEGFAEKGHGNPAATPPSPASGETPHDDSAGTTSSGLPLGKSTFTPANPGAPTSPEGSPTKPENSKPIEQMSGSIAPPPGSATPPPPPSPPASTPTAVFTRTPSANTGAPGMFRSSPSVDIPPRATSTPPASSAPRVERYTVTIYTCQPGDTWEKVSKDHYMTEQAAAALREYNRNDPRASASLLEGGTITAGDKVYIPQLKILERHGLKIVSKPESAAALNTAGAHPPR